MSSVNRVHIVGHLGRDPETRYTQGGDAVSNISVATSQKWNDKQTGEKKEETEWHRVSFFGKLAEVVGQYLVKGSLVYVEGRLKTRKWTDKDGVERYTTEIIADRMQMLGGKPDGAKQSSEPAQQEAPRTAPAKSNVDDLDDDIPF